MKFSICYATETRRLTTNIVPETSEVNCWVGPYEFGMVLSESEASSFADDLRRKLHEVSQHRQETWYNHNPSKR